MGNGLVRVGLWLGMGGDMRLLTVAGRKTGKPMSTPVTLVIEGGEQWLVAPYGERQWVKNLRADPNASIGSTAYVAREIPERDRQAVLTAYREKAGRAVESYFRKLPREADHPVFVLTPKG